MHSNRLVELTETTVASKLLSTEIADETFAGVTTNVLTK